MKVLAIETSTMLGGVAIMDDSSGLVAEIRLNVKTTHSERLMTAVDSILKQSDLNLSQIDVFAVSSGPGSFTGLRIGFSTVKGLSYATKKPIVTVPTLEAFAWNFLYSKYPVCIMLDARKAEVYAAVYEWKDDAIHKICGELSIKPADLVKGFSGRYIFAGDGALIYQDKIKDLMNELAIFAPAEKMVPSPANVAMLGLRKAIQGEYTDTVNAVPFYIRKSEAEVKWLEKIESAS